MNQRYLGFKYVHVESKYHPERVGKVFGYTAYFTIDYKPITRISHMRFYGRNEAQVMIYKATGAPTQAEEMLIQESFYWFMLKRLNAKRARKLENNLRKARRNKHAKNSNRT